MNPNNSPADQSFDFDIDSLPEGIRVYKCNPEQSYINQPDVMKAKDYASQLLTAREVCRALRISRWQLRNYCRHCLLNPHRIGMQRFFSAAEVSELMG